MLQRRFRGRVLAGGSIALAAAIAIAIVIARAPASGNGAETPTTFSGSSSGAIVIATNSGTGHAIKGHSGGNAITGISTKANGVVGQAIATPSPMPSAIFALAGVLGQDVSTGVNNVGVVGTSALGHGVEGISTGSSGVVGFSVNSSFGVGVEGISFKNIGVGAFNLSDAQTALLVFGGSGLATPAPGNPLFRVANHGLNFAPNTNCGGTVQYDVASIDQVGNLVLCGTSTTSGTPLAIRRTIGGARVVSYAAQQTQPTIEDFGQGHLVNGQAYVRLEPGFAALIDPRAAYLVFLTPGGDNRGLYVSQKTRVGFLVRESQGGHATLAFDYRIAAKPFDSAAPRLPLASSLPQLRAQPETEQELRFLQQHSRLMTPLRQPGSAITSP